MRPEMALMRQSHRGHTVPIGRVVGILPPPPPPTHPPTELQPFKRHATVPLTSLIT